MDEKKTENKEKFIDLDSLLKPDESLVFYSQNIPSAGKLNRMLLAGYYALRWIDEKIDNVTQFMENIMAINAESTRIIGLPEKINGIELEDTAVGIGEDREKINPADDVTAHYCTMCHNMNAKKYYEIPYIYYKKGEYIHFAGQFICVECAKKLRGIDILANIYEPMPDDVDI